MICTIEARMGSSRLPGKVLLVSNRMTMLELMVKRVSKVFDIKKIVIATSTNPLDDAIMKESQRIGVSCFRGSESDVQSRVLGAAVEHKAKTLIALTGDCPLIDPKLIKDAIETFEKSDVDYLSNALLRSYPDGMDTQVLRVESLRKSSKMTTDAYEREHVTLHMYRHPEIFKLMNIEAPLSSKWPTLGLTLDEKEDFVLIDKIISFFYPRIDFDLSEIISFLRHNPGLIEINKRIIRTENK